MKILSIDTACDETSAAVTENETVLSNVVWSQASLHAKWGGILPSLAQREHKERIDWVVEKALKTAFSTKLVPNAYSLVPSHIDAIAVTAGPCLAIAGEVGIAKAKEIAVRFHKPLLTINHLEGHILSPLARPNIYKFPTFTKASAGKQISNFDLQSGFPSAIYNLPSTISFPALGLVISGGNTQLIHIKQIGNYKILAETHDDALGESLDKAARMLGLGYPGGAILETFARLSARQARKRNPNLYPLPIPMLGKESLGFFSYSGVKTAMWKLVEKIKKEKGSLKAADIENLAASYQNVAFEHLVRVISSIIHHSLPAQAGKFQIHDLLVGGGVSSNVEVRKRLRKMAKGLNMKVWFPYSKKLCSDNAAMIGIAAYFKAKRGEFVKNIDKVDREPRIPIGQKFNWEE